MSGSEASDANIDIIAKSSLWKTLIFTPQTTIDIWVNWGWLDWPKCTSTLLRGVWKGSTTCN